MIKAFQIERDAHSMRTRIFGILNVLDRVERDLSSDKALSVTYLVQFGFVQDIRSIRAFVQDKGKVALFKKLMPGQKTIVEDILGIADSLERLHLVQSAIIEEHLTANKRDLVKIERFDAEYTLEDRAALSGLTPQQRAAWEHMVDEYGVLYLSRTEKATLLSALQHERSGADPVVAS